MLERFLNYIATHKLIVTDSRVLLAVSGGIDSIVMAYIFNKTDFNFGIAHCNFKLRGIESDREQQFVGEYASKYNIEFYTANFNTKEFAKQNNLSIQMAARELRYKWFDSLAKEKNYNRIAIAHNRDDIIETFLINMARGTGLNGLTGIKVIQNNIIRPLLFASRKEIENFAKSKKIEYREDSSNLETKYYRNLIRHKIIPLFESMNPSFRDTIISETEVLQSTYKIYCNEIERLRKVIKTKDGSFIKLSIPMIISLRIDAPVFFDILKPYGFNFPTVIDILNALNSEPGKKFYSDNYVLLKDRNELIIEELTVEKQGDEYFIDGNCSEIQVPLRLTFKTFGKKESFNIPDSNINIALDYDLLSFPLALRKWKEGDYFYPLGMKGRKKISDFFTDRKINRLEKVNTWILTSGKEIVWIVGHQIDDRFKISSSTKKIFLVSIKR
ncbi:MAG: tRNA lysidine(34) synthetase TilS [Bacteroidales bacterium]|nr:tRNA lysidine(34) synthetase TilS [Bacteroidales bacterium]